MVYVAFVAVLFASCHERRVYDRFECTPAEGWEQGEVLSYDVPKQSAGSYRLDVCVRTTQAYAYRNLALVVETEAQPSGTLTRDTVQFRISDERVDVAERKGVSCSEVSLPVTSLSFAQGDSLHVTVRHLMRRNCLTGVSDVGVILLR